jgi:hypothetical protein
VSLKEQIQSLVGKLEAIKLLGGVDERGGIILKWILHKFDGRRRLDSSDSGGGQWWLM